MQRGWGGRGGLFGSGDPFNGFGGFIPPRMPSFFGGSSSFNDPLLANPFGSMVGPSLFEQSFFGSSMFGPPRGLNGGVMNAGGFQQQVTEPSRPQGLIIEELSSDDDDAADADGSDEMKKANPMKHPRISREPYVEEPDEVQGWLILCC
jgi:hypothetical protein